MADRQGENQNQNQNATAANGVAQQQAQDVQQQAAPVLNQENQDQQPAAARPALPPRRDEGVDPNMAFNEFPMPNNMVRNYDQARARHMQWVNDTANDLERATAEFTAAQEALY